MDLAISVRNRTELLARLNTEQAYANREIIKLALEDPTGLSIVIRTLYDTGISRALRHSPNGDTIERLELILWITKIDLDLAKYCWLQFGVPKLEAVSQVLEFPWPDHAKIKMMVKGKKCEPTCSRCFEER
jgi:hypothetical protein